MIPRRAAYTVPPELRRLREAWAWARGANPTLDSWGADCPGLTHQQVGPGLFVLSGKTVTGGGMSIAITATDCLQALRVEANPSTITLPLPARHRRVTA